MRPSYEDLGREELLEAVLRLDERLAAWCAAQDHGIPDLALQRSMELREAAGYPVTGDVGKRVSVPMAQSWGEHLEGLPEDVERPVALNLLYKHRSLKKLAMTHWGQRERERQALAAQVMVQSRQDHNRASAAPLPIPRRIHYQVFRRQRMKDLDNLIGGLKDVQDVIEAAGLIWEDSMEWIVPTYVQDTCGKTPPRVEVLIWDIPESTWTDAQRQVVMDADDMCAGFRKKRARIKAEQTNRRKIIHNSAVPEIIRKKGRLRGGRNKNRRNR